MIPPLIMKDLSIPLRLILTAVLIWRLRNGHIKHPKIEKDLAKRWAGYWGEIALTHYVKELPQKMLSSNPSTLFLFNQAIHS